MKLSLKEYSFKLISPAVKSGGIIGSQSILLPSSIRNRNTDETYLAEILKRNPGILGSGLRGTLSTGSGLDIHKLIGKLPRPKKDLLFLATTMQVPTIR